MKRLGLKILMIGGGLGLVATLAVASVKNAERDPSTQVIGKELQASLTPDQVINLLKEGNERFVKNQTIGRSTPALVKQATQGQYPKAIVLSCVDSRVPVEEVFDVSIGDIFVARVAGNVINEDILGSMEFATKVAGSKAIVVLGHEHCGAVKSAVDDVKLGNITPLLAKIQPAVQNVREGRSGDTTSKNKAFVDDVCKENVHLNVASITIQSPVIAELVKEGQVKVIGGMYDLDTGKVEFYEQRVARR